MGISEASIQDSIDRVKSHPGYATKGAIHVKDTYLSFLLMYLQITHTGIYSGL